MKRDAGFGTRDSRLEAGGRKDGPYGTAISSLSVLRRGGGERRANPALVALSERSVRPRPRLS